MPADQISSVRMNLLSSIPVARKQALCLAAAVLGLMFRRPPLAPGTVLASSATDVYTEQPPPPTPDKNNNNGNNANNGNGGNGGNQNSSGNSDSGSGDSSGGSTDDRLRLRRRHGIRRRHFDPDPAVQQRAVQPGHRFRRIRLHWSKLVPPKIQTRMIRRSPRPPPPVATMTAAAARPRP